MSRDLKMIYLTKFLNEKASFHVLTSNQLEVLEETFISKSWLNKIFIASLLKDHL